MRTLATWLFYGIPSFSLVIFFIFFLRGAEFQYSFYRVIQCDMIINIFCYLNTWISRLYHVESTIPFMIKIHDNFYCIFHIYSFFANYFYNAQCLSVIAMSGHRLWTSLSKLRTDFWKKNYGYIYGSIVAISGLLATSNIVLGFYHPDYYDHEKKEFLPRPIEKGKSELENLIFLVKSSIYFSALFIINIWTIFVVLKRVNQSTTSLNTNRLMRNLTTVAFINSFLFFLVMLWPIGLLAIAVREEYQYFVSMIVSDLLSLHLPYVLMACDRNVQTVLSKISGKCTTSTQIIPSSTENRRQMVQSVT